jgi:hypothetical protein
LAGYSTRDIERVSGTPHNSLSRYILKGYEEYGDEIGTKHTIVRENKISPPRTYQRETLMRYPNGLEYVGDIIESRKWTTGGGKRVKSFSWEGEI